MSRKDRQRRFLEADLYPVISPPFSPGRTYLDVLRAVLQEGVKMVQLRCKDMESGAFYSLAKEFRHKTTIAGALLIINDRLDIALAAGADGVHLGQSDLPLEAARKLAPNLLLGASAHNQTEAEKAVAQDADYFNVGPIYATETKKLSRPPLGVEAFQSIHSSLDFPCTVMGGIKAHNLELLLAAGAQRPAMVTEITCAQDIAKTVKKIRRQILSFSG